LLAHQQVSLPVAGHRSVLDLGRPLGDRHHLRDAALAGGPAAGLSPLPPASQVAGQIPAKAPPRLDVERLVDRLGGDAHLRVVGIVEPQSGRDLLRRAAPLQHPHHHPPQPRAARQLRQLRAPSRLAGAVVCPRGPIAAPSRHPADLATDCRRRPAQPSGDGAKGIARGQPGADLLALDQRQPQRRARPAPRAPRGPATRPRQHPGHRPLRRSQLTGDRNPRLATGDPIHDLQPLPTPKAIAIPTNTLPHRGPPSDQHNQMLR
jgi:hypothetical protein